MTHYKEDEELVKHLREDSGYQSFKQNTVTTESSSLGSSSSSSLSEHLTHTEVRTGALINATHPVVLSSAVGLAHDIVENQTFAASAANVNISEHSREVLETPELREQRLKDEAKYHEKQEEIARKHEKHQEKITEEYRNKTEHEAEKIRRELEKQYKRDIDYRKEIVNDSVKRQKQELELEVKYSKKELEHERLLAQEALAQSKMQMDVQVNLDTSIGHTVSGGSQFTDEEHTEHKSLASKMKDTFGGN